MGEQLVRDRQIGVEVERPPERRLRAIETLSRPRLEVLRHHVMDAAEARPRWRVTGILLDTSEVQIARDAPLLRVVTELVAPQKVFVGLGDCGDVALEHVLLARRQRQRERGDDAPGELVLDLEHVADRHLRGVGPQQGAARRVGELRRDAKLVSSTQQGARHDHVDVRVGRDLPGVRRLAREAGGRDAGAHDQRGEARERARECVGQAERQKLGVGVRPQHAERQHDETGDASGLRGAGRLDGHEEPVAAPRKGLDELGGPCRVAEGLADLADAEVQALLEVDERVAGPDVLTDLAPPHHLAAAAGQEGEHLEGLRRQLDDVAVLTQLASPRIELEGSKAEDRRLAHRKLIPNSGPIYRRSDAWAL